MSIYIENKNRNNDHKIIYCTNVFACRLFRCMLHSLYIYTHTHPRTHTHTHTFLYIGQVSYFSELEKACNLIEINFVNPLHNI